MNKSRYSEKDYLCDYDLSLEFFKEIGINTNDITPLRKVFILHTDQGNKILKKVNYNEERINFISDSLDYVKKGFKNIITYNKLKNNFNYIKWKDNFYIVMDILDGREAAFSNPVEIDLCAKSIALMHNSSKGLREYLSRKYNKDFLDISLEEKYNNAYYDLIKMKELVSIYKYRNEFDELFIKNVDNYIDEIKTVHDMLKNSSYEELRNKGDTISICHNDLAYHNFIVENKEVSIIDFDFMSIDLRVIDIGDFLLKSIKNVAFDIDKMMIGLDAYEEISPLSKDEKELILYILKFPRDFYTIVKDYYYKRKKWDYEVYLNRFKAKLNNEEFRYEFLEQYEKKL